MKAKQVFESFFPIVVTVGIVLSLFLMTSLVSCMNEARASDVEEEKIASMSTTVSSCIQDDIIMYSDETPKLVKIWEGLKNPCSNLKSRGFEKCKSFSHYTNYFDSYDVYVKEEEKKIKQILFIQYKRTDTKEISLVKQGHYLNETVLSFDKWEIPTSPKWYKGDKDTAITLSWKYIDICLHNHQYYEEEYKDSIERSIYDKIRNEGIENVVIRLLWHCNPEKNFLYRIDN